MNSRSIYFGTIIAGLIMASSCYRLASQVVCDIDGNRYRVVRAGRYQWMAENLKVAHDPQGNKLDYYAIENPYMDTSQYGFLYSWTTAMDSSEIPGTRGICPDQWHLPTDAEWDSLTEWAGGINKAGLVLKKQGIDEFSVLMAGNYNLLLEMNFYFGEQAYFWTSDQFNHTTAWMRHFGVNMKNINRSTVGKHYGFSIRCVRAIN